MITYSLLTNLLPLPWKNSNWTINIASSKLSTDILNKKYCWSEIVQT